MTYNIYPPSLALELLLTNIPSLLASAIIRTTIRAVHHAYLRVQRGRQAEARVHRNEGIEPPTCSVVGSKATWLCQYPGATMVLDIPIAISAWQVSTQQVLSDYWEPLFLDLDALISFCLPLLHGLNVLPIDTQMGKCAQIFSQPFRILSIRFRTCQPIAGSVLMLLFHRSLTETYPPMEISFGLIASASSFRSGYWHDPLDG